MPKEHQPEQRGTHNEQPEPQEPWAGGVENVRNWSFGEKGLFIDIALREGFVDDFMDILSKSDDWFPELLEQLDDKGVLPSWEEGAERRYQGFNYLYAGAVLGHVLGKEMLSHLERPDTEFPWVTEEDNNNT